MTNKRATKRALLTSVLAICLCLVMLIGSTFAWFTDTASTGVNTITSGKLDIQLVGAETDTELTNALKWTQMVKNTEHEMVLTPVDAGSPLWEPGVTFLTEGFRIKNNGNLALKFKINVNKGVKGTNDAFDLKNVIDFAIVTKDGDTYTPVALENFEGTLSGKADNVYSPVYYLQGHMQESAGNDYQGKTLDSIVIGVVATQWNYEYDSFDNTYDKSAAYPSYPAGVTAASFPETAECVNDQGTTTSDKPATVAYVDANGEVKYAADLNTAIARGASVIYCKENAKLVGSYTRGQQRTAEVTNDLTIYANGADFQNTEISLNETSLSTGSVGKTKNLTLKIYDAKNIRVWGNAPAEGVTQNILLENCTFEGKGINSGNAVASGGIFYVSGTSGAINLTMNNCKVSGSDQGVYSNANGTITINNCTFANCAAAMKISHKATGACNVTVTDTTFNQCGWNTEVTGKEWLKNDSSAIKCKTTGTMTLTLNNVAITNMIGDKSIVAESNVTVTATTVTVDGAAWTVPGGGNFDPEPGDEP